MVRGTMSGQREFASSATLWDRTSRMHYSRRLFLWSSLSTIGSALVAQAQDSAGLSDETPTGEGYDPALLPPPESEVDYVIVAVDPQTVPQEYRRTEVPYDGWEPPGSIIVDPINRYLYYIREPGMAIRYGVGVGKQGFEWSGDATVGMKRRWPRWVPPTDMVERDARAKKWANGMPGGPENPLGARALYLFDESADTLYRIHGTNEPESIGKAASSGCIRMLNEDIVELFDKVEIGSPVHVRGAS
jgi:lipoprotein-anchoring transpeptidase ErfK/SrfK